MSTIHQSSKHRKKKNHSTSTRLLFNCPQRKGTISKLRIVAPKKPNSAKRKVAKINMNTGHSLIAKVKGRGTTLQPYSVVLVCGGRANDVPGVRYNLIKGALDFSWREDYLRKKSRSKYGIPSDWDKFYVPTNKNLK